MPNYTNPKYDLLVDTFSASATADGAVLAVGLPPLKPVIAVVYDPATGKPKLGERRVKYHMYPEFPDILIVNDWVTKLKSNLDRQAADLSSVAIMIGTGDTDTGFFLLTPWSGGMLKTSISMLIDEAETRGEDSAMSIYRKSLEGKGLL